VVCVLHVDLVMSISHVVASSTSESLKPRYTRTRERPESTAS
jgi:hypothetical protein